MRFFLGENFSSLFAQANEEEDENASLFFLLRSPYPSLSLPPSLSTLSLFLSLCLSLSLLLTLSLGRRRVFSVGRHVRPQVESAAAELSSFSFYLENEVFSLIKVGSYNVFLLPHLRFRRLVPPFSHLFGHGTATGLFLAEREERLVPRGERRDD